MPILCSKSPKTGVPKAKKHKNADFVLGMPETGGFQRAKKHKNPDFVLEKPENGGSEGKKRTKTSILCSGGANSWEKLRIRNRGDAYDYIDEDYKR